MRPSAEALFLDGRYMHTFQENNDPKESSRLCRVLGTGRIYYMLTNTETAREPLHQVKINWAHRICQIVYVAQLYIPSSALTALLVIMTTQSPQPFLK